MPLKDCECGGWMDSPLTQHFLSFPLILLLLPSTQPYHLLYFITFKSKSTSKYKEKKQSDLDCNQLQRYILVSIMSGNVDGSLVLKFARKKISPLVLIGVNFYLQPTPNFPYNRWF